MNNRFIFAAMVALTFAACSSNEEEYLDFDGPVEVRFSGGFNGIETRTGDATNEEWTDTHKSIAISTISVLESDGVVKHSPMWDYREIVYNRGESDDSNVASFSAASTKIYFESPAETVVFSAYSPYDSSNKADDSNNITLAVTNSSVVDYIWASSGDKNYKDNSVAFQFGHVMSKLNVKADKSDEVSSTISNVTISGLKQGGTFNIKDGKATVTTDDAADITYSSNVEKEQSYIIVPQTAATLTFTLTMSDGVKYQTSLKNIELSKGKSYTYTIKAKKYELDVTAAITAWEEESSENSAYMTGD